MSGLIFEPRKAPALYYHQLSLDVSEATPMRSDTAKKGTHRAPHGSLLRATGQISDDRDFNKRFIANSAIRIRVLSSSFALFE
jgi:hypothetical protein